ncbi:type IV secretion protein Rhs [Serratia ficaria]|uniref:type IV secretion protein Rhs n=1 Tax=Serratia ficaria TaxID=61651 RepID=UPI0021C5B60F|nr:type IV secretion protein Rhs [Serratia ficaria]
MTLDDDIRFKISELSVNLDIIDDWETIADELSDSFEWTGSKINWSRTKWHRFIELHGDYQSWVSQVFSFLKDGAIKKEIDMSNEIYYINDSSLDFAVKMSSDEISRFLELAIKNIPQHHYLFERNKKWCIVISSEGYIDFGVSNV